MARQFSANDSVDFGAADYFESISALTYMADVYLDNITADHAILSKDTGGTPQTILYFDDVAVSGNDRFSIFISGTLGGFNRAETDAVSANKWYRVLGRYNANTLGGIYVKLLDYSANTITKYTNSAPATTMNQTTLDVNMNLAVGETAGNTRDMEGRIANVFAHDAVFSETVEDLLLRSPNPMSLLSSAPRLFCPMWGDESPMINLGSESNGTVSGTIPQAAHPPTGRYVKKTSAFYLPPAAAPPSSSPGFSVIQSLYAGKVA